MAAYLECPRNASIFMFGIDEFAEGASDFPEPGIEGETET
jgi:hypothetical protein